MRASLWFVLSPAALLLALLPAAPTASAQVDVSSPIHMSAPAPGSTPVKSQYHSPTLAGCPVHFSAQRRASNELRYTSKGVLSPAALAVDLNFAVSEAPLIASAEVIVHGDSGEVRVVPVGEAAPASNLEQSFHIESSKGKLTSSELWLEKIVTVRSVELTRVTFRSGVLWEKSDNNTCSITPSLYLPVSSH